MKIKLIKIKHGYYDLAYLDAVSSLKNKNNNNIIELSYSNKKAQSVAKKNLNYFNMIFPEISKAMNQHHNVSLSNDFWRILIGPWLIKSIEYFYDKYIILEALPKGKKYKIKGFNYKNFNFNNIYDLYLNENFINYSINILNLTMPKQTLWKLFFHLQIFHRYFY